MTHPNLMSIFLGLFSYPKPVKNPSQMARVVARFNLQSCLYSAKMFKMCDNVGLNKGQNTLFCLQKQTQHFLCIA